MNDWKTIPTSKEVYQAIWKEHGHNLTVFSSYSDPTGSSTGGSLGKMYTAWGFKDDADFPTMEITTTWDIDAASPQRRNERHDYRLCVGKSDTE